MVLHFPYRTGDTMNKPSLMGTLTRNTSGIVAHVALTVAAMSLALTLSSRGGVTTTQILFVAFLVACGASIVLAFTFWRSGSSPAAIGSSMMAFGLVAMAGAVLSKNLTITVSLAVLAMALFVGAIVVFVRLRQ
jgi:FtsH-binding integral membrane protein